MDRKQKSIIDLLNEDEIVHDISPQHNETLQLMWKYIKSLEKRIRQLEARSNGVF